jgi:nicotinamide mononucleotide (NMN) deamidase PncC
VGTTWVAVSGREGEAVETHRWEGDREVNKELSVEAALALLLRALEQKG